MFYHTRDLESQITGRYSHSMDGHGRYSHFMEGHLPTQVIREMLIKKKKKGNTGEREKDP